MAENTKMKLFLISASDTHKTWKLGPFYISHNAPGLISKEASWVIVHKCWMYGPWPSLWRCLKDLVFKWQHDRNLFG